MVAALVFNLVMASVLNPILLRYSVLTLVFMKAYFFNPKSMIFALVLALTILVLVLVLVHAHPEGNSQRGSDAG